MVGRSEDGGWTCVQRDQKDSTFTPRAKDVRVIKMEPTTFAGTHRAEGGNLLDTLLVVRDFIPRRALLAEPEHPAAPTRRQGCEQRDVRDRQRAEMLAYEHTYFGGDGRRRCRWRHRCPWPCPFLALSRLRTRWIQRSRSAWRTARAGGARCLQRGRPGPGLSRSLSEKLRWSWRGSGTGSGSKSSRP